MKTWVQVLGSSGGEMMPSILVHFDSCRYLINCGEGTQRFCAEHKIRLGRLDHLFFTRLSWETFGGVPGMVLTLSESGMQGLHLHGPRNLTHALATSRSFIQRKAFKLDTHEFELEDATFKDGNLTVTAIPIRPESVHFDDSARETLADQKRILSTMFTPHSPSSDRSICDDERCSKLPRVSSVSNALPAVTPDNVSLCLVFQGPQIPPKFDKVKAKALGVPNGPLCGQLVKGHPITLPDGRVIQPSDVCLSAREGPVFYVIDVPSIGHMRAFLERRDELNATSAPDLIFHILAPGILREADYQQFISSFPKDTQHVVFDPDMSNDNIVFTSSALQQVKLSWLDDKMYPIPYLNNTPSAKLNDVCTMENVCVGEPLLQFDLEPLPRKFQHAQCLKPFDPQSLSKEISHADKPFVDSIAAFKSALPVDAANSPWKRSLHFYGTGSMLPSKYRNVSSFAVSTSNGHFLMDCGEGTLGQMLRQHGTNIDGALRAIRGIFISHMHADHHLGLIRILQHRQRLATEADGNMVIIGPWRLWNFLTEYNQCERIGLDKVHFIDCSSWLNGIDTLAADESAPELSILKNFGMAEIKTATVDHCPNAFALIAILDAAEEGGDQLRLVYSGDTRPCENLIDATLTTGAQETTRTVLVHEATFNDDLQAEAIDRRHSTVTEAIGVGKSMGAATTVLTHFSQRYPILSTMQDSQPREGTNQMPVGMACDGMAIDLDGPMGCLDAHRGLVALVSKEGPMAE